MKYNKSSIMKKAWEIRRMNSKIDMSSALKTAWGMAKLGVLKLAAEETRIAANKFTQGMEIIVGFTSYELRRWTNYGKDRVYVTGGRNRSGRFVDLLSDYNNLCGSDVDRLVSTIRSLAY